MVCLHDRDATHLSLVVAPVMVQVSSAHPGGNHVTLLHRAFHVAHQPLLVAQQLPVPQLNIANMGVIGCYDADCVTSLCVTCCDRRCSTL